MPKSSYPLKRFEGGLNNASFPTDVEPDELSLATNVSLDSIGRIKLMGGTTAHDSDASSPTIQTSPGYGLFRFNSDWPQAHTSNTNLLSTGDSYLALTDAYTADVWIWSETNGAWSSGARINMGATSGAEARYYYMDGALRVCDGAFGAGNMPMWYGFINRIFYGDGTSGYTSVDTSTIQNGINVPSSVGTGGGWVPAPTALQTIALKGWGVGHFGAGAPNDSGLDGDHPIGVRIESQSRQKLSQSGACNLETDFIYSYNAYAVAADNKLTFTDTPADIDNFCGPGDRIHIYSHGDWSSGGYIKMYTVESSDTNELVVEEGIINWGSSGSPHGFDIRNYSKSQWYDEDHEGWECAVSTLYDDIKQESALSVAPDVLYASTAGSVMPVVGYTSATESAYKIRIGMITLTDSTDGLYVHSSLHRISGFKIYLRRKGTSTWYLQSEVDISKGIKTLGDDPDAYVMWDSSYDVGIDMAWCKGPYLKFPREIESYESETGLPSQEAINSDVGFYGVNTGWKSAVLANDTVYAGNVKITDQAGNKTVFGDRMLKSIPGQYDAFHFNNYVDISTNDGDEIIKLEAFADRILQFKKNKLHIINVSQEAELLEDTFFNLGVDHSASTCETDYGIAWANKNGVYHYDGQQIHFLLEKGGKRVIGQDRWTDFLSANKDGTGTQLTPMVAYVPNSRKLIIFDDISSTGNASPTSVSPEIKATVSRGGGTEYDMMMYDFSNKCWTAGTHTGNAPSFATKTEEVIHTFTAADADAHNGDAGIKDIQDLETTCPPILGMKKLGFDQGTVQISPGDNIWQAATTPKATVVDIVKTSGNWIGGSAAGNLYVTKEHLGSAGAWADGEVISIRANGVSTAAAIATGDSVAYPVANVGGNLSQLAYSGMIKTGFGGTYPSSKKHIGLGNSHFFSMDINDAGKIRMSQDNYFNLDEGETVLLTYDTRYNGSAGTDRVLNKIKTNPVIDNDGNLLWSYQTNASNEASTLVYWDDTPKGTSHLYIRTPLIDMGSPTVSKRISKIYISHRNAGNSQIGLFGEFISKRATGGHSEGEISNDFFVGLLVSDFQARSNMITQEFSMPTTTMKGSGEAPISFSKIYSIRFYIQTYMNYPHGDEYQLAGTAPSGFEVNDISLTYRMGKAK